MERMVTWPLIECWLANMPQNVFEKNDDDKWLLNEGGNQLFFYNEPDLAFSFITIAQFGQDYKENKDGYIYLYSPSGKYKSHILNMARVKKEDILAREKWEFFVKINKKGNPEWISGDIEKRGVVHSFPSGWGFYSWSPSVIWNEKLGLFIMACAGTQKPGTGGVLESYMHYEPAGLMMLWAENPWGPWNQFFWDETWDVGDPDDVPRLSDAFEKFDDIRTIKEEDSGLITLSIEWTDPVLAAEWANDLVWRLNERLRSDAITEADETIKFLNMFNSMK